MTSLAFLAVLFAVLCAVTAAAPLPTYLTTLAVKDAAFMTIGKYTPTGPYHLAVTSFSPFGGDFVTVSGPLDINNLANTRLDKMSGSITWPNEPSFVDPAILGTPALAVGGGFLVPLSETGAITLYDLGNGTTAQQAVQISVEKSQWFYHRVEWYDVDGDGDKDIITARAYKPIFGSSAGELVWYENPGSDFFKQWKLHHIVDGPDIFFQVYDIDQDGVPEVIATQFFSKEVVIYWTTTGSWNNGSIQSRVIDTQIGSPFDVRIVDLNADGKKEFLIGNHEATPQTSAVYAYEVPSNYKTGTFTRHTLASGFVIRNTGPGQGTPGDCQAFYPSTASKLPSILVSGDGSQEAYILDPTSQDFVYNKTVLHNYKNTVGQPAIKDINGDGFKEIFIPSYENGLVYAYTYKPSSDIAINQ